MRRTAGRGQSRQQHGACVRVRLDPREGQLDVGRRHAVIVDARYRALVAHGKLITIEGLDGAGKSTLAAALARAITERGVHVELLREPGGVAAVGADQGAGEGPSA